MDSIKSMGTEGIQHKLSIYWRKGKENKSTKRIITTLRDLDEKVTLCKLSIFPNRS